LPLAVFFGIAVSLLAFTGSPWLTNSPPASLQTDAKVPTPESEPGVINPVFQETLKLADGELQVSMEKNVLKVGEDLLSFWLRSPWDGYVVVHVLSSDQSLVRLLPNARTPEVMIRAGQDLHLPPVDEPILAAGPPGTNQFLVTVTEQPRSHGHLEIRIQDGFGLITGMARQLEGISNCQLGGCRDRLAATWFAIEEVK
ncbi:MAG TPA: DUF4384 domain-containing protein, partial [Limnobacter sp.]|nr:DUF4384 domain-containing protein [Limnobacter sp.]